MTVRIFLALALVCPACASHEPPAKPTTEAKRTKTPDPNPDPDADPDPEPDPEPKVIVAKASIASVQMIEDCPDGPLGATEVAPEHTAKEPAAAADQAPAAAMPMRKAESAEAARVAPGSAIDGSGPSGWHDCTQSTMQIAFTGQGDASGRVVIESVRMLDPKTKKVVGKIQARRPTAWTPDGSYKVWNEVIPAKSDVKASYRLSVPDWTSVERDLGTSSWGYMFMLEVDVTIDGEKQTVRSPEFPREQPHVVVT